MTLQFLRVPQLNFCVAEKGSGDSALIAKRVDYLATLPTGNQSCVRVVI
ncbi:hypothetical protein [Microseira wollei]|nr:hypothetical protein [Microseira wollei]